MDRPRLRAVGMCRVFLAPLADVKERRSSGELRQHYRRFMVDFGKACDELDVFQQEPSESGSFPFGDPLLVLTVAHGLCAQAFFGRGVTS